mmetsp:Transcript_61730/g.116213  ORF Transcript_61730/g.116213 Transcript_61730/m.116213 type:complete len:137 (-) Transcript_61730:58-468(-)
MNDMKKVKKITSMLHGKPVYNKTRFAGMARLCSGNMKRLQPYVTFEDGFSGAPDYEIETSYFGLLGGSWSPQEFKCLEYYDWDISPPRSASSSKQTIKKVVKPLYEQRQPTSRHSKKRAGRAMENTNSNFTFLIFC